MSRELPMPDFVGDQSNEAGDCLTEYYTAATVRRLLDAALASPAPVKLPLTIPQIERIATDTEDAGHGWAGDFTRISNHGFFTPESLLAFVRAIEAAIAKQPTEPGWRPISQAPKKGDMLVHSSAGRISLTYGRHVHDMISAAKVDGEECFYTHFMPLPAPPKDQT